MILRAYHHYQEPTKISVQVINYTLHTICDKKEFCEFVGNQFLKS